MAIGLLEIILAVISFLVLRFLSRSDGVPRNWPLVGMLPDAAFHVHRVYDRFTEVLERCGCNFLFKGPWFSNMVVFCTSDPANVHYVMSSNFSNFPKGSEFSKMFDILGDGIFNSDSDRWKNQRQIALAFIHHRRFHQFLLKTSREKVEKGLIPVLEHVSKQGLVVDLQDLLQRFTFDVTCILVTGYDPGCLSIDFPEVQFSKALDDAEEAIFYRHVLPESLWKLLRWLGVGKERKMKKAWETIDHILAQYTSRKRQELKFKSILEEEEGGGIDLLTSYITEAESMGSKCDDKFLRDTIMNFLLAGRDTTSSALTWFLWLVSNNPQVETKIREELKSAIPVKETENCKVFNMDELNKLVYLHGALCESLRLYPPVPFQHKVPLHQDILPSGHHVDPNMKIVFSLYAMGRMTSIWGDDCLEFKPERWVSDRGRIKQQPSYKFLAFNAGPRTCLGKEVAFIQMKAAAAAIIHNYNVQVLEGHPVIPKPSIILHMKHGLKVRVSRRTWV